MGMSIPCLQGFGFCDKRYGFALGVGMMFDDD